MRECDGDAATAAARLRLGPDDASAQGDARHRHVVAFGEAHDEKELRPRIDRLRQDEIRATPADVLEQGVVGEAGSCAGETGMRWGRFLSNDRCYAALDLGEVTCCSSRSELGPTSASSPWQTIRFPQYVRSWSRIPAVLQGKIGLRERPRGVRERMFSDRRILEGAWSPDSVSLRETAAHAGGCTLGRV